LFENFFRKEVAWKSELKIPSCNREKMWWIRYASCEHIIVHAKNLKRKKRNSTEEVGRGEENVTSRKLRVSISDLPAVLRLRSKVNQIFSCKSSWHISTLLIVSRTTEFIAPVTISLFSVLALRQVCHKQKRAKGEVQL
jgi:hypothetical protein